jgi:Lrp/AsnC family transcriptional regulator, leucine-responsive regulatory protein
MGEMGFDPSERLDDVDRQILCELQDDGRISLAELSRRVSLSAPAVSERIRRLQDAGVITGYTARVDPRRLGFSLLAYVRLSPPGPAGIFEDKVTGVIRDQPEVLECHHITGDDCYLIKLAARDPDHLQELIARIGEFGRTTTSLVLSSPVPTRPLLPPVDRPTHA